jgi:hypothetical protein
MADPCPDLVSAARAIVVATPARAATAMTSRLEYLVVMTGLHRVFFGVSRLLKNAAHEAQFAIAV